MNKFDKVRGDFLDSKILLGGNREVYRIGDHVRRIAKPWSKSVLRFLRHLENDGLPVEHIVSLNENFEISAFVEGEMVHPNKWSDNALYKIGKMLSKLHTSSRGFKLQDDDIWQDWFLRHVGKAEQICCHGDIAPWNVITENGHPKVLLDWEMAGPADPFAELARVCWLFVQLFDDDLQAMHNLPSPKKRAEQVRIIADAYGLTADMRKGLVGKIIEVIICETALEEAVKPAITFDSVGNLWGFAWRIRSLHWVWRHQDVLKNALK